MSADDRDRKLNADFKRSLAVSGTHFKIITANNNELVRLPDAVFQQRDLQQLLLMATGNLDALQDQFDKIPNLQRLLVGGCKRLNVVPKSLSSCKHLKEFAGCQVADPLYIPALLELNGDCMVQLDSSEIRFMRDGFVVSASCDFLLDYQEKCSAADILARVCQAGSDELRQSTKPARIEKPSRSSLQQQQQQQQHQQQQQAASFSPSMYHTMRPPPVVPRVHQQPPVDRSNREPLVLDQRLIPLVGSCIRCHDGQCVPDYQNMCQRCFSDFISSSVQVQPAQTSPPPKPAPAPRAPDEASIEALRQQLLQKDSSGRVRFRPQKNAATLARALLAIPGGKSTVKDLAAEDFDRLQAALVKQGIHDISQFIVPLKNLLTQARADRVDHASSPERPGVQSDPNYVDRHPTFDTFSDKKLFTYFRRRDGNEFEQASSVLSKRAQRVNWCLEMQRECNIVGWTVQHLLVDLSKATVVGKLLKQLNKVPELATMISQRQSYRGAWIEGRRHDTKADGNWDLEDVPGIYTGKWEHDKPHGNGRWSSCDSSCLFEGEFRSGKRHGMGREEEDNGQVAHGFWEEDRRSGSFIVVLSDKSGWRLVDYSRGELIAGQENKVFKGPAAPTSLKTEGSTVSALDSQKLSLDLCWRAPTYGSDLITHYELSIKRVTDTLNSRNKEPEVDWDDLFPEGRKASIPNIASEEGDDGCYRFAYQPTTAAIAFLTVPSWYAVVMRACDDAGNRSPPAKLLVAAGDARLKPPSRPPKPVVLEVARNSTGGMDVTIQCSWSPDSTIIEHTLYYGSVSEERATLAAKSVLSNPGHSPEWTVTIQDRDLYFACARARNWAGESIDSDFCEAFDTTVPYKVEPEAPPQDPLRARIEEIFEDVVGQKHLVEEVFNWACDIRFDQLRGAPPEKPMYHCMIGGEPGMGKTLIAHKLQEVYREVGIVQNNKFKSVAGKSELVKGFVGQTHGAVTKLCREASGGVLFLDEAPQLADRNDTFCLDAVKALMNCMMPEGGAPDFAFIGAGYHKASVEGDKTIYDFIEMDQGLGRRFRGNIFILRSYSKDELFEILEIQAKNAQKVILTEEARAMARDILDRTSDRTFKNQNGGAMEMWAENSKKHLGRRGPTGDDRFRLSAQDIHEGWKKTLVNMSA